MKTVTDRTSNPFGMRAPFEKQRPGEKPAAYGYGDVNADFHLIGDHPSVHGGRTTGVPFTECEAGERLQSLFADLGFVENPGPSPDLTNLYWSYLAMCNVSGTPSDDDYADLERFFDAELRAINAHILVPVGERATDHVLGAYTTQRDRVVAEGGDGKGLDMTSLHGREIRGRGFLVVPTSEPADWESNDREKIRGTLQSILQSDYRQTKGVATMVG